MDVKEQEEREEIRRLVLQAKTLEEVREARRRLHSWLLRHPNDKQMLGEGESLIMLEKALH